MGIACMHGWCSSFCFAAFHCGVGRSPTSVLLFLGRYHFAGSYRYSHVFVLLHAIMMVK